MFAKIVTGLLIGVVVMAVGMASFGILSCPAGYVGFKVWHTINYEV